MDLKTVIRQLNDIGVGERFFYNLGLEPRVGAVGKLVTGAGIFAAGALVGAGIGLLLAPMPGEELRMKAKESIDQVRNRLMNLSAEDVGELAEKVTGRARGRKETTTPAS